LKRSKTGAKINLVSRDHSAKSTPPLCKSTWTLCKSRIENHYAMDCAGYMSLCPFCCPFGNLGLPRFLASTSPSTIACTQHSP
jgi:hypothetical protein